MKNELKLQSKLLIIVITFVSISISHVKEAEAYNWNTPLRNSPKVEILGDNLPNFDANAVNLQIIDGDNKFQLFDTNGKLKLEQSIYTGNDRVYIRKNETAKITKAGIHNGKYIDIVIKNTNTTDVNTTASNTPYISLTTYGQVLLFRRNMSASDIYVQSFTMKIVDHDTGNEIPNQTFYLPAITSSANYQYGTFNTAYDKVLTKKYLIPYNDIFLNYYTVLDTTTSTLFDFMSTSGFSQTGQGQFTIYGSTGTTGYQFGFSTNINVNSSIILFDPTVKQVIPSEYRPLAINQTATGNEDGTKASLVMKQVLPIQPNENYVPVNNSFKLSISENNTDFFNMSKDDFQLFVDNVQVPADGSAYTLNLEKSGEKMTVNITLTSDYLKKVNAGATSNKTLEIRQTSSVSKDQTKITTAIENGSFEIPISSSLTYTLSNGLNKNIETPMVPVELSLTPTISADSITDVSVLAGTLVGDINLDYVIDNLRNNIYSWDNVTATYDNPTASLNTAGKQEIAITLKSSTFGNVVKMNVPVLVTEVFNLKYDANGGQGTSPAATTFGKDGISLASQGSLSKAGFNFAGWGTTVDGAKIYQPGSVYGKTADEAHNTTLYAIWKKPVDSAKLGWQSPEIDPKNKTQSVDKSTMPTTLNEVITWSTSVSDRNYVISVRDSTGKEINNKKLESNGSKVNTNISVSFDMPTAQLNYGNNDYQVGIYVVDAAGKATGNPLDSINLRIIMNGSLQLVSVPSNLSWTNRLISKGTLNRDAGNTMEVKVIDTRNISDDKKTWSVSAQTKTVDEQSIPFELDWKKDSSSPKKSLKEKQLVLTKTEATKVQDSYSKKWDEKTGVLLFSNNYLNIGDYSNKVIVNWSLYDTATAE